MPLLKRSRRGPDEHQGMELDYQPQKRRKIYIVLGVILAVAAGALAFTVLSSAQNQNTTVATKRVLVAARDIPARTVLQTSDLTMRDVPDDASLLQAIGDANQAVGRVTGVPIVMQQPILPNLLLSSSAGGKFSILEPQETIAPNGPVWRAVSVNIPDDRAVGGQLQADQHVDLFVTVQINVEEPEAVNGKKAEIPFYTDKSTKVTYQDIAVLAKNGTFYILKVDEKSAEEISHIQASGGGGGFSLALRPEGDHRKVDGDDYGQTTNKIVEKYGLPVPEKILLPRQVGR